MGDFLHELGNAKHGALRNVTNNNEVNVPGRGRGGYDLDQRRPAFGKN
jgi:hypothetical protein